MPRVRNEVTGAVMSVSEFTASRLGSGWVPAGEQPEPDETPKRRGGRPRKADSDE